MSSAHVRYLVLEQGVGAGIVNFAINAGIAWLLFRHMSTVPLWGQQSIAGDTIGTCFFLPFLTGLIVTPLARGRIRAGKLAALGWSPHSHPALGWLPRGTTRRALTLGAICMLLVAPVAVAALALLGVASLHLGPFVLVKATFAAALAVVVTPIISIWAIADLQPEQQS